MALTDSLVAYYKLEEASGTRVDATGRGNDLSTVHNTPTNAAGVLGNALKVTKNVLDGDYVASPDVADLSFGDIDFSFSVWLYFASLPDSNGYDPFGKWGGSNEYFAEFYKSGSNYRARWRVNSGDLDYLDNSMAINTWYHYVYYHDSVNNLLGIAKNGAAATTLSYSSGCTDGSTQFSVGFGGVATRHFDGRIDSLGVWKKVLTTGEILELYNSGAGLEYPFSSGQPAALRHGATGRRLFGPRIGAGGW